MFAEPGSDFNKFLLAVTCLDVHGDFPWTSEAAPESPENVERLRPLIEERIKRRLNLAKIGQTNPSVTLA